MPETVPEPAHRATSVGKPPATTTADAVESLRRPRPGRLRRLVDAREWRVRTKLVTVLALPTLAFLALAGVNLATLVLDARAHADDARTAALGRDVARLVHELQRERDLSSGYFVVHDGPAARQLATQRREVDQAVGRYRDAAARVRPEADGRVAGTLGLVEGDLRSLVELRDTVDKRTVTQEAAVDEYGDSLSDLLDVVGGITGQGDTELTQRLRTLAAFQEAKARASEARGTLYTLALADEYDDTYGPRQFQQVTTALANEQAALDRFLDGASDEQRIMVNETVRGQAVLTVARLEQAALQGGDSLDVDSRQWLAASSARQQKMAQAERRLLDGVVGRSQELSDSAERQAWVTGGVIAGVLLVSMLLSLLIARSMARQLSRLRRGALDVAQVQLPDAVTRIREGAPGVDVEREVPSLNLHTRDEVGQVAAAFDAVHRQAVRLAGEQAMLRRDVNTLFVNFSRRSQSLVERQLSLIDELEAGEQDPDVLDNLFRLDHLATRMRRNNESLLVIAGSDTTRRWTRPVPLPDVVLAAVAEIEQFTRVVHRPDPGVAIAGHAVSDVVHLLAELLENATRSSPPSSNVTVSGRAVRGGSEAVIEVTDSGIGMTKEGLRSANRRLGDAPGTQVPQGPRMGLFVVSRLARRYGITVDLTESAHGGIVATVRLPSSLVTAGGPQGSGGQAEIQGGGRPAPAGRQGSPDRDMSEPAQAPSPTGRRSAEPATSRPSVPLRALVGDRRDEVATVVLPVFDSVSEWFQAGGLEHAGRGRDVTTSGTTPPRDPAADGHGADALPRRPVGTSNGHSTGRTPATPTDTWASTGDAGWAAAHEAASPSGAGVTKSGLPIRRPMAHFVPGSSTAPHANPQPAEPARRSAAPADRPQQTGASDAAYPGAAPSSPDQVRGVLSTYYRGIREAREASGAPNQNDSTTHEGEST